MNKKDYILKKTKDVTNADLQKDIEIYAPFASKQLRGKISRLKGKTPKETARNVWRWIRKNVKYKADAPSVQRIKLPSALFRSKVGDCKSMALAAGAALERLGFKVYLKYTGGQNDRTPGHVYIIAEKGGELFTVDPTMDKFNIEAPYTRKKVTAWKVR